MSGLTALLQDRRIWAASACGISAALGVLAGYKYAENKLGAEFDERLSNEIRETKRLYTTLYKADEELSDPITMAKRYEAAVEEAISDEKDVDPRTKPIGKDAAAALINYAGYSAVADDPDNELDKTAIKDGTVVVDEPVVMSIFPDIPDEPDYSTEKARRNPDFPYIISQDEFYANETDYSQSNLTYFEGDDTLLDEREMPMEETDRIVGDDNLTRFGQWSKDPNIVHIRNENLKADYEIVRSPNSYGEEVGGFIKHSHDPRPRKRFRHGEDE